MHSASSPPDEHHAASRSSAAAEPGAAARTDESDPIEAWLARGALLAVVALFAAAFAATAWVSDDAFITFRTVENALGGYGLVWNAGERVQAYTHPLWMLLLVVTSTVTGDVYIASLVLGAAATAAALAVLTRKIAASVASAALAIGLLFGSRAFVDYASSGLENPLSHLWIAALFAACARPGSTPRAQLLRLGVASLCALTRLDLAFIVVPLLVWAFARDGWPRPREWLLGATPFLAWEAFSLIYYGDWIANSARAKLNSGVDATLLAEQGLRYFAASLRSDPLSIVLLVAGPVLAFARRDAARWALGAAVLGHCAWVVANGGDFMQGRFLTPALFLAAIGVARSAVFSTYARCALAVAVAAVALLVPWLSPFVEREYGEDWHAAIDANGIADERHFHRDISGLGVAFRRADSAAGEGSARFALPWHSDEDRARAQLARDAWFADPWLSSLASVGVLSESDAWPPRSAQAAAGLEPVLVKGGVGLLGYRLGPGVTLIDYHGLGDPLLSRLPAVPVDPVLANMIPRLASLPWRVGHYLRPVPAGYAATRSSGENRIVDPGLAELFDRVQLVVSGPIASRARFGAIVDLHTSWAQSRIDAWVATVPLYDTAR